MKKMSKEKRELMEEVARHIIHKKWVKDKFSIRIALSTLMVGLTKTNERIDSLNKQLELLRKSYVAYLDTPRGLKK